MKSSFRLAIVLFFLIVACSTTPTATPRPNAPNSNAPTLNAPTTPTPRAITLATNPPTIGATVTPPALPQSSPTLALLVSPSITPLPTLPTPVVVPTKTLTPIPSPTVITAEILHGKILFKSARDNGQFPNKYQYYAIDPNGNNLVLVDKKAAERIYQALKPLEGYSPDKNLVVVGERSCASNAHCDLYIGEPSVVLARSQGVWTPRTARWSRADNPAWSPDGEWVAFVWNRDNDRTKNIFKGEPSKTNQDFKRLTDFGGHKDVKDPTYSPDGRQLAFAAQQDGTGLWQIWILDATAQEPTMANAHILAVSLADDWDPLWIK